ncbi:MAG: hypothetical protein KAX19_09550 [Candidatus Brocadiae bacterium]|nr:hypothetical protein [Candidatus Brocadiia bacterium]
MAAHTEERNWLPRMAWQPMAHNWDRDYLVVLEEITCDLEMSFCTA